MSILVLTSDTLIGTAAAGNIEYNGQFFVTDSAGSRAQLQRIVQGTPTASSGTALTYSSLPTWVKRITISIASLQATGGSIAPLVQLSTSSTFKTSGYLGAIAASPNAVAPNANNLANGFATYLPAVWSTSIVLHGTITLTLLNASTYLWTAAGNISRSDSSNSATMSGSVTLTGTLDGVRLFIDGTQTFTAGSINIIYEG
jgi:hypothetical protein